MICKNFSVAVEIIKLEAKAFAVYCHCLSLNLRGKRTANYKATYYNYYKIL